MKRQTPTGFEKYGKTRRRARFLADMDRIIPWPQVRAAAEAVYLRISEVAMRGFVGIDLGVGGTGRDDGVQVPAPAGAQQAG
jgi:hypothetical protein